MNVLPDFDSTDNRPISRAEISALIQAIRRYPNEAPRPKPGKDKAVRPLYHVREKYSSDPLPLDNCVCADNPCDHKHTFTIRYLENIVSACRQWTAVVRKGQPTLLWQRVGTGRYRLRRGQYLSSPEEGGSQQQTEAGRLFVERRRNDRRSDQCPPSLPSWRTYLDDPNDERSFVRYLKELYLSTGEALANAEFGFTELTQRDSNYPCTHCLLLGTRQQQMDYGHSPPVDLSADLERAREVVRRAGGACYSFHIAQGTHFYHRHQVQKAIWEFEQAAQMSSYFAAWRWLAECYATVGETQKALEAIRRAGVNCDYREPSLYGIEMLIRAYSDKPQQALQLPFRNDDGHTHPKNSVFHARARLALAFLEQEKKDEDRAAIHLLEAEKLLDAAKKSGEGESLWLLTEYLNVYGAGLEIGRCLEEGFFEKMSNLNSKLGQKPNGERAPLRALQFVAWRHYGQALQALDRAVEERDSMVLDLQWDPRFFRLRNTRQFQRLCKDMRQRFTKDTE